MHGSYGSPEENLFRWLERELKSLGHEVILEQFPVDSWDEVEKIGRENIGAYKPVESLESWDKYFIKHILPQIKESGVGFVGHSIAPIFMLHMLGKYDFKLQKAVFVAPFFNIPDRSEIWQFYPVNKTFYSYDFDFDKIKEKISKSHGVSIITRHRTKGYMKVADLDKKYVGRDLPAIPIDVVKTEGNYGYRSKTVTF